MSKSAVKQNQRRRKQSLFSREILEEYGARPPEGAFIKTYSADQISDEDTIRIVDVETTARHPGEPVAVKTSTPLGGTWANTVGKYLRKEYGTVDMTPRLRVLAVNGQSTGTKAWDMDALALQARADLVHKTVHGKILVGHNFAFDLGWLMWQVDKANRGSWNDLVPQFVLDTSLIMRMRSILLFDGLSDADRHSWTKDRWKKLFSKDNPRVSMEAVIQALEGKVIDKSFQKPQNWGLSTLDVERYAYVTGDVTEPVDIIWHVTNSLSQARGGPVFSRDNPGSMVAYLRLQWPWLEDYSNAIIVSARAGRRGVPINTEYARTLEASMLEIFNKHAKALIVVPEFASEEVQKGVLDYETGEPGVAKEALVQYITGKGGVVGRTDKGDWALGDDALALIGFAKDPVCSDYMERRRHQRYFTTVKTWREFAEAEGDNRIHPSIAHRAMSLRESAESPNGQNPPAEEWFRKLVEARPGRKISSWDYSAIELRIGAALAVRGRMKFERMLKSPEAPVDSLKWIWKDLRKLILSGEKVARPLKPDSNDPAIDWTHWRDYYVELVAHLYWRSEGYPMRDALIRVGDLHLVTALAYITDSDFSLDGMTPTEFLATKTHEERELLKKKYKDPRKKAKAVNFGTLYGSEARGLWEFGKISYGMEWTLEEAAEARMAWLSLYPDAELWQVLTKLTALRKNFRYWTEDGIAAEPGKLWLTATLAGRQSVSPRITNALNSQDQGTGGDILAKLKSIMWTDPLFLKTVEPYFILSVHDEILLDTPDEKVAEANANLEKCMIQAADFYLAEYGVPVGVEGEAAQYWKH